MERISRITDEDINEKIIEFKNPKIRYAARGIVVNLNGDIGIFFKKNKNEYKLPGGGNEDKEEFRETFKREVLEETGCEVDITECLGYTEEIKSKESFMQVSYVYIGKVIKDTNIFNLTEKEIAEGGEFIWCSPKKALELIDNAYDNLKSSEYENIYHTKFINLRDKSILENYISKLN